MDQTKR